MTQEEFYAGKRRMLESLLEHGVVQIHVDPRVPRVEVPQSVVKTPWDLTLNLSWAFRKPMELGVDGIAVVLTFGGVEHACFLPWGSVFSFAIRGGDDVTVTSDAPAEVLAALERLKADGVPYVETQGPAESPPQPDPAPAPETRGNVVRGPWAGSL